MAGLPDDAPSAFAAFKEKEFDGSSISEGSTTAHGTGLSTPVNSLGLGSRLPSRAFSLSRARSAPLATARSGGSASRGPPALWRTSSLVTEAAAQMGFSSLSELCGASYISSERLIKPKSIGEGAFAEVFRAVLVPTTDGGASQTVAVKRLKPDTLMNEQDCKSFISEACLLIKMDHHPAIVQYIGLGSSDDSTLEAQWRTLYIVQEYASKGTIKKLILDQMISPTRRLYSLGDAIRWCAQIAEGLEHLHTHNPKIIHRDMKTENILLMEGHDGKLDAKLSDFGLHALVPGFGRPLQQEGWFDIREEGSAHGGGDAAAALRAHSNGTNGTNGATGTRGGNGVSPASPQRRIANTRDAALLLKAEEDQRVPKRFRMTGQTGAWVYMAPEVLMCESYNEKVDVFSFGIIMYELLHRKAIVAELMYLGDEQDAKNHAYKIAQGWRMDVDPELPAPLRQLLFECWASKAENRPDVADVARRLREMETAAESGATEFQRGPSAGGGCCAVM